jgi:hypothetical protein
MPEHVDEDLRQAAKAAAGAAAVGAAVGVARAIAARAGQHAHRDDPVEDDEQLEDDERLEPDEPQQHEEARNDEHAASHEEPAPRRGERGERLRRLTEQARQLLEQLSGADVESVSALDRTAAGWRVTLEAVEVRRVPETMDVLATYDVELDGDGDLVRYERRRRYARSQSDHGDGG